MVEALQEMMKALQEALLALQEMMVGILVLCDPSTALRETKGREYIGIFLNEELIFVIAA